MHQADESSQSSASTVLFITTVLVCLGLIVLWWTRHHTLPQGRGVWPGRAAALPKQDPTSQPDARAPGRSLLLRLTLGLLDKALGFGSSRARPSTRSTGALLQTSMQQDAQEQLGAAQDKLRRLQVAAPSAPDDARGSKPPPQGTAASRQQRLRLCSTHSAHVSPKHEAWPLSHSIHTSFSTGSSCLSEPHTPHQRQHNSGQHEQHASDDSGQNITDTTSSKSLPLTLEGLRTARQPAPAVPQQAGGPVFALDLHAVLAAATAACAEAYPQRSSSSPACMQHSADQSAEAAPAGPATPGLQPNRKRVLYTSSLHRAYCSSKVDVHDEPSSDLAHLLTDAVGRALLAAGPRTYSHSSSHAEVMCVRGCIQLLASLVVLPGDMDAEAATGSGSTSTAQPALESALLSSLSNEVGALVGALAPDANLRLNMAVQASFPHASTGSPGGAAGVERQAAAAASDDEQVTPPGVHIQAQPGACPLWMAPTCLVEAQPVTLLVALAMPAAAAADDDVPSQQAQQGSRTVRVVLARAGRPILDQVCPLEPLSAFGITLELEGSALGQATVELVRITVPALLLDDGHDVGAPAPHGSPETTPSTGPATTAPLPSSLQLYILLESADTTTTGTVGGTAPTTLRQLQLTAASSEQPAGRLQLQSPASQLLAASQLLLAPPEAAAELESLAHQMVEEALEAGGASTEQQAVAGAVPVMGAGVVQVEASVWRNHLQPLVTDVCFLLDTAASLRAHHPVLTPGQQDAPSALYTTTQVADDIGAAAPAAEPAGDASSSYQRQTAAWVDLAAGVLEYCATQRLPATAAAVLGAVGRAGVQLTAGPRPVSNAEAAQLFAHRPCNGIATLAGGGGVGPESPAADAGQLPSPAPPSTTLRSVASSTDVTSQLTRTSLRSGPASVASDDSPRISTIPSSCMEHCSEPAPPTPRTSLDDDEGPSPAGEAHTAEGALPSGALVRAALQQAEPYIIVVAAAAAGLAGLSGSVVIAWATRLPFWAALRYAPPLMLLAAVLFTGRRWLRQALQQPLRTTSQQLRLQLVVRPVARAAAALQRLSAALEQATEPAAAAQPLPDTAHTNAMRQGSQDLLLEGEQQHVPVLTLPSSPDEQPSCQPDLPLAPAVIVPAAHRADDAVIIAAADNSLQPGGAAEAGGQQAELPEVAGHPAAPVVEPSVLHCKVLVLDHPQPLPAAPPSQQPAAPATRATSTPHPNTLDALPGATLGRINGPHWHRGLAIGPSMAVDLRLSTQMAGSMSRRMHFRQLCKAARAARIAFGWDASSTAFTPPRADGTFAPRSMEALVGEGFPADPEAWSPPYAQSLALATLDDGVMYLGGLADADDNAGEVPDSVPDQENSSSALLQLGRAAPRLRRTVSFSTATHQQWKAFCACVSPDARGEDATMRVPLSSGGAGAPSAASAPLPWLGMELAHDIHPGINLVQPQQPLTSLSPANSPSTDSTAAADVARDLLPGAPVGFAPVAATGRAEPVPGYVEVCAVVLLDRRSLLPHPMPLHCSILRAHSCSVAEAIRSASPPLWFDVPEVDGGAEAEKSGCPADCSRLLTRSQRALTLPVHRELSHLLGDGPLLLDEAAELGLDLLVLKHSATSDTTPPHDSLVDGYQELQLDLLLPDIQACQQQAPHLLLGSPPAYQHTAAHTSRGSAPALSTRAQEAPGAAAACRAPRSSTSPQSHLSLWSRGSPRWSRDDCLSRAPSTPGASGVMPSVAEDASSATTDEGSQGALPFVPEGRVGPHPPVLLPGDEHTSRQQQQQQQQRQQQEQEQQEQPIVTPFAATPAEGAPPDRLAAGSGGGKPVLHTTKSAGLAGGRQVPALRERTARATSVPCVAARATPLQKLNFGQSSGEGSGNEIEEVFGESLPWRSSTMRSGSGGTTRASPGNKLAALASAAATRAFFGNRSTFAGGHVRSSEQRSSQKHDLQSVLSIDSPTRPPLLVLRPASQRTSLEESSASASSESIAFDPHTPGDEPAPVAFQPQTLSWPDPRQAQRVKSSGSVGVSAPAATSRTHLPAAPHDDAQMLGSLLGEWQPDQLTAQHPEIQPASPSPGLPPKVAPQPRSSTDSHPRLCPADSHPCLSNDSQPQSSAPQTPRQRQQAYPGPQSWSGSLGLISGQPPPSQLAIPEIDQGTGHSGTLFLPHTPGHSFSRTPSHTSFSSYQPPLSPGLHSAELPDIAYCPPASPGPNNARGPGMPYLPPASPHTLGLSNTSMARSRPASQVPPPSPHMYGAAHRQSQSEGSCMGFSSGNQTPLDSPGRPASHQAVVAAAAAVVAAGGAVLPPSPGRIRLLPPPSPLMREEARLSQQLFGNEAFAAPSPYRQSFSDVQQALDIAAGGTGAGNLFLRSAEVTDHAASNMLSGSAGGGGFPAPPPPVGASATPFTSYAGGMPSGGNAGGQLPPLPAGSPYRAGVSGLPGPSDLLALSREYSLAPNLGELLPAGADPTQDVQHLGTLADMLLPCPSLMSGLDAFEPHGTPTMPASQRHSPSSLASFAAHATGSQPAAAHGPAGIRTPFMLEQVPPAAASDLLSRDDEAGDSRGSPMNSPFSNAALLLSGPHEPCDAAHTAAGPTQPFSTVPYPFTGLSGNDQPAPADFALGLGLTAPANLQLNLGGVELGNVPQTWATQPAVASPGLQRDKPALTNPAPNWSASACLAPASAQTSPAAWGGDLAPTSTHSPAAAWGGGAAPASGRSAYAVLGGDLAPVREPGVNDRWDEEVARACGAAGSVTWGGGQPTLIDEVTRACVEEEAAAWASDASTPPEVRLDALRPPQHSEEVLSHLANMLTINPNRAGLGTQLEGSNTTNHHQGGFGAQLEGSDVPAGQERAGSHAAGEGARGRGQGGQLQPPAAGSSWQLQRYASSPARLPPTGGVGKGWGDAPTSASVARNLFGTPKALITRPDSARNTPDYAARQGQARRATAPSSPTVSTAPVAEAAMPFASGGGSGSGSGGTSAFSSSGAAEDMTPDMACAAGDALVVAGGQAAGASEQLVHQPGVESSWQCVRGAAAQLRGEHLAVKCRLLVRQDCLDALLDQWPAATACLVSGTAGVSAIPPGTSDQGPARPKASAVAPHSGAAVSKPAGRAATVAAEGGAASVPEGCRVSADPDQAAGQASWQQQQQQLQGGLPSAVMSDPSCVCVRWHVLGRRQ